MALSTIQKIDRLSVDCDLGHQVVHGAVDATVQTEGGAIPTMAGAVNSLKAYNVRGAWVPGMTLSIKDVFINGGIAYVVLTPIPYVSTDVAADIAAQRIGVHQGATREELAASSGTSLVGFQRAAAGSVPSTAQDKLEESVSVREFMTVAQRADAAGGNPTMDVTGAFNLAIAALPANGGTIDISYPLLLCNLVHTKCGVTFRGRGTSNWQGDAANSIGLAPFDPTKPTFQVGNDTGYVVGTRLHNISIVNPGGSGQFGLKLYGGTYGFQAEGFVCAGFLNRSVWVENGATYPATYISFTNFCFSCSGTDPTIAAALYCKYGPGVVNQSFTTGIYLQGGNISSRSAVARQVWLDGVILNVANLYVQTSGSRSGLYLERNYAGSDLSKVIFSGGSIDAGSNANISVEVKHSASQNLSDFVQGQVAFSGSLETSDGTLVTSSSSSNYSLYPYLAWPITTGRITFPDKANWADKTASIFGGGTANSRTLTLTGDTISLAPGYGAVRLLSVVGDSTATLTLLDQLNNRAVKVVNSAGTLRLSSYGSGSAVRVGDGAWNGQPFMLGPFCLWVDASGRLRIKNGTPTSDLDGTAVGSQS
jgi:hypothetical protein